MPLRSNMSTYLGLYCVLTLVVLAMARGGQGKAAGGCTSVLTFSSESQSSSEGNGNIHVRSLSPWTWKSTTVENRIPSTIWEAECNSSYCSDVNPSQPGSPKHNSVPIHQHILVLNQTQKKNCYTASYLSVTVGCTCVRAKTSIGPQQHI